MVCISNGSLEPIVFLPVSQDIQDMELADKYFKRKIFIIVSFIVIGLGAITLFVA